MAEDDARPVQLDLPVARHLRFTETHALELVIYIGLLAYFGVQIGEGGAILTLLIGIVRFVMSDGRAKGGTTRATHRMGFHDVRQEPAYFGAGFLAAFAAAAVGIRVWTTLGLGSIAWATRTDGALVIAVRTTRPVWYDGGPADDTLRATAKNIILMINADSWTREIPPNGSSNQYAPSVIPRRRGKS